MKIYDLIIVGAGPAGITAAKTVVTKGLSTLILEKGMDLTRRRDLTSGWFGHGLFAMSRLELEDGVLNNQRATKEIFKLIQKISSQQNVRIFTEGGKRKLCRLPEDAGKRLASYLFDSISTKADVSFNSEVLHIKKKGDLFAIKTKHQEYKGKRCLVATGKNSIEWVEKLCEEFDLHKIERNIKVGVRVEIPTFRISKIIEERGDLKVKVNETSSEDTRINSFVGEWEESDILSAFGHDLLDKESRRSNFMVGFETKGEVSKAIRDIKVVNILANDRIKKERIIDFLEGRSILKHIKSFDKLREVFNEIEKNLPSFTSYAIMYVPEVRLRGTLPVDRNMRTRINNLYGAGECTVRVSNLIGAMASGLVSARTILEEL